MNPESKVESQDTQNKAQKSGRVGRVLTFGAISIAVITAVTAGILRLSESKAHADGETEDKPKAAENPDEVKLEEAQLKSVKLDEVKMHTFTARKFATGKISFNDDATTPVFTPYTGRITKIFAKLGDTVEKGSILFEIDTPDLVQAESDLINAHANLRKSKVAAALAQRSEAIARRNIEIGKLSLDLAKKNEDRQKSLFELKVVAERDSEQAQRDVQQAQRDIEQAQKDLEQALSDTKSAESDIFFNETAVSAGRDRLRVFGKTDEEIDKIERDRVIDRLTRVHSPISGTVISRKVGMGQWVKPDNADPVFTVSDLSKMWMLADVNESDIAQIKNGQEVEVSALACPGEIFKARIAYISPAVDPVTRRIAVRCEVDNASGKLKSEMYATFNIITDTGLKSLAVKQSALVREGARKCVWVKNKENTFIKREITTGMDQDDCVQILAGIKEGESVVTGGALFLGSE